MTQVFGKMPVHCSSLIQLISYKSSTTTDCTQMTVGSQQLQSTASASAGFFTLVSGRF